MSLSVRVRFEILKRDRYTCAYCGKHPPDVLLEVDHIVPRAAGGSDEPENLTTACSDCNRGKADRLLEEGIAPTVNRERVDELRERVEQAAAYAELVGEQRALVEKQLTLANQVWAQVFRADTEERSDGSFYVFGNRGQFPNERSLRLFIRRLPLNEVVAAMDLTASRHADPTAYACRFFYKVCWRRIKGESGPIDEGQPRTDKAQAWHDYWMTQANDARDAYDEIEAQLNAARERIVDLEEEVADLRAIVATYQEKRSGDPFPS